MVPVQVRITRKLVELLDELVEQGTYSNRSEAIRDAIRRSVHNFHDTGFMRRVENKSEMK